MVDDLLTMDHLIILLVILILGVSMSVLKREPEPFKNMIESGRTFYNKHRRLVRTALDDTSKTLTNRVNTRMRLAGF
jgi:hypothetical protein